MMVVKYHVCRAGVVDLLGFGLSLGCSVLFAGEADASRWEGDDGWAREWLGRPDVEGSVRIALMPAPQLGDLLLQHEDGRGVIEPLDQERSRAAKTIIMIP